MKAQNKIFFLIFFGILFSIFYPWFFHSMIIGGDWPFYFQESVKSFSILPPVWKFTQNNGLGGQSFTYALDSYFNFTGWFFSDLLHIPWIFVYKIVWFGMFLVLSVFSSVFLLKKILPKSYFWQQLLAGLLYTTNTYVLLVVGGGQMGVALGYAFAPFVLKAFIDIIVTNEKVRKNKQTIIYSLIAGILFSIQILFDVRIAYLTFAAANLYFVINAKYILSNKRIFYYFYYYFLNPLLVTLLLHSFWLIPNVFTKFNPTTSLGSAYTSLDSVRYFSFATFENAFGLLHPYWPNNIFGNTGFMKPEFLILPLIAYASLLFVKSKVKTQPFDFAQGKKSKTQVKGHKVENNLTIEQFSDKYILFFALLGLLGAFLAKGANDPFGNVYLWIFNHVPGFVIFRDPTKFYTLVALSYSVLIPYSLSQLSERIVSKYSKILNNFGQYFVLVIFLLFWLITIRQAVFGQLGGTFAKREVPSDYIALKNKLVADNYFYRTLWVPSQGRFAFTSDVHPAIEANPLFSATDSASLRHKLSEKKTESFLSELGVKYVIIPDDIYGEIFQENLTYSKKKHDEYEKTLDKIPWLKKVQKGKLTIYETETYQTLFWITPDKKNVSYKMINPTHYEVFVKNVRKGDKLFFSQNYDSGWLMDCTVQNTNCRFENVKSQKLATGNTSSINTFILPKAGNYVVNIYYSSEKFYVLGGILSLSTLILVIGLLIFLKRN